MAQKSSISNLLHDLANAIDRVGERRVRELLLQLAADENVSTVTKKSGAGLKKGVAAIRSDSEKVNRIIYQLNSLDSIDAGRECLDSANLTRRELEAVARAFDVPVRKDIRVEGLEDLILNVTIGGRLNSLAIRGA